MSIVSAAVLKCCTFNLGCIVAFTSAYTYLCAFTEWDWSLWTVNYQQNVSLLLLIILAVNILEIQPVVNNSGTDMVKFRT